MRFDSPSPLGLLSAFDGEIRRARTAPTYIVVDEPSVIVDPTLRSPRLRTVRGTRPPTAQTTWQELSETDGVPIVVGD